MMQLATKLQFVIMALLTTAKFFITSFDLHEMAFLFLICISYNSKFSLTSKCLGTNVFVVKRVHCAYIPK